MNDVIPEIKLIENIEAPIAAGQKLGTIKYKVDDIEYSANLLAKTEVIRVNYSMYFIMAGLVLLLVSFRISNLKSNFCIYYCNRAKIL